MASGPGLAPLAPSPQSASHPTEVGFKCELGGRQTCVHLHLHLHLHVNITFLVIFTLTVSSPSPPNHHHLHSYLHLHASFTFSVFHRLLVGMLATRATVSYTFTSLLFSLSHLLLSSMSLHLHSHLHSHLHLHSLPPVLCGQAGHQGHGFLQLHFSSSSLSPYGSPCSCRNSPCKPRLPTMWVLIAELGVDERVSGTPFTSQLFPAVHAAVVIPPVSLGSPQCGY